MIAIGERIRGARQARGFSQGDLEHRTGLLRCYLSRVENGHTEPSLQTLARIAAALDMPLVQFFVPAADDAPKPAALADEERQFLADMRECAAKLGDAQREQVLALARKMAAGKG